MLPEETCWALGYNRHVWHSLRTQAHTHAPNFRPKVRGYGHKKPEEKTTTKPIHGKQLVLCRVLFRVPDHGGLRASRRKDTPKNSKGLGFRV